MNSLGKSFWTTMVTVMVIFVSTGYMACKDPESLPAPDACSNIDCKNGGTCIQGTCSCPGGFEGESCEIRAIDRYLGNWNITESVTGSSKAANLTLEKKFTMNIAAFQGSNVEFVMNDFMGEPAYDNIKCRLGMNAKQEGAIYTEFGLVSQQTIAGAQVFIKRGGGQVNNFGTIMSGSYIRSYTDNSGVVTDTVNILGERN